MKQLIIRRLGPQDVALAKALFLMMAEVFGEESEELGTDPISELLSRPQFWALAALHEGRVIGGLTAHTLPMTTSRSSEILIYDIAIRDEYRRRGIGRQLLSALRKAAALAGVEQIFVLAEDEDLDALKFYRALGGVPTPVTMFTFRAAE